MKKTLLLLLFALPFIAVFADVNKNKSLTYTLGYTYTINPVSDVGFASSSVRQYNYVVSDTKAFSIAPVKVTHKVNGISESYYKYEVTPLKTGTYTISQQIDNSSTANTANIIYSITVVDVTKISIPQTLSLSIGDSYTFNPTITDSRAKTSLTWVSGNTSVATINGNGVVSTVSIGTATITCLNSNGVSAQCVITVNPVLVNGIALNESEAKLTVGDKLQLDAEIAPNNATDKSVTWSSTNESVAVVGENGLVTAVGSGTCQIKALANDGSGKTASCLVTVEKNNKLTVSNMTLCKGGQGALHIQLTNEDVVSGFQFDLALPAGVTVSTDKDGLLMTKLSSRASSHNITASKVSDGLYRFIVVSMANNPITQGDGDVMTITLETDANIAMQEYDVTLQNIGLTVNYVEIHPRNNTAKLTVTDATLGDVNGDSKVSVTDVISIIGYILEEEPARFIFKAADVNNDKNVTVTDAIMVIDMILNKQ